MGISEELDESSVRSKKGNLVSMAGSVVSATCAVEMRISVRRGVNRSSRVGPLPKSLAVPQYAVSQFAARSRSSQFAIIAVESRSRSRR